MSMTGLTVFLSQVSNAFHALHGTGRGRTQMLENPMVSGLSRHLARQEAASDAYNEAHEELFHELQSALYLGCTRFPIKTPGFGPKHPYTSVADLVSDHFSGESGAASLDALLKIVAACATGADGDLKAMAEAWITEFAGKFADFHAGDLADGWNA